MRWPLTLALGFTTALASTAFAQRETTPRDTQKDTLSERPTTVTGCLTETGGKYSLTNVAADHTTEPQANTRTGTSMPAGHTYTLSGGNLKGHVGHKVEITGTLASTPHDRSGTTSASGSTARPGAGTDRSGSNPGKEPAPTVAPTPPQGATGSSSAGGSAPHSMMTLNVQSVKMIAATCS